eukprot:GHRR01033279.1.p1 GENE.GHRR01033279.1~~GHRR01033279.1.p1  ORF type:complete len:177 (-),score=13.54 GHRR01033279.1:25-555(-)
MHCLLSAIIQLTWCCDYCQRGINAAMRYSEPSSDSNALLYAQKHRLNSHCDVVLQSNAELPAWAVLSSAGLGGIAYWLVIFPVDVIKSSMQTDSIIKSKRRFPNMSTAAKVRHLGLCLSRLILLCHSYVRTCLELPQRHRFAASVRWQQWCHYVTFDCCVWCARSAYVCMLPSLCY